MSEPDTDTSVLPPAVAHPWKTCAVPYVERPYSSEHDEAMVYFRYLETMWRGGYRKVHGRVSRYFDKDVYELGQRSILDALLKHADCTIATNPTDLWQIFGFIITDDLPSGLVVHYVWTKHVFQRAGITSNLIRNALAGRSELIYSHLTGPWIYLMPYLELRGVKLTYNPYLAK